MTPDLRRLRRLAVEYAELSQLVAHTPQSRGQRLNGLLADMFEAWGHRARADLNSRGNIDVAFAIDDQRFVLEAKWEQSPIGTGPIAKLQKRVRQRLGGTIGVFVSMSGYSADAIADIKDGERLEVILLDRRHVEAMITGFSCPTELINMLLDRAHFYGDPTATLESLVLRSSQPVPRLTLGPPEREPPALRRGAPGLSAEWVVSGISSGQHGLSIFRDERLLLNTNQGLVILDLASGIAECPTSPTRVVAAKALSNGAIAVVRHHGVAVINDGHISVRAGPFGGLVTFATAAADENLVVFSNDTTGPGGENERFGAAFAVLGDAPGQELVTELEYPPLHGFNAIQLSDGTILVLGNPPALCDANGTLTKLPLPVSNPFSGAHLHEDGLLLVVGGDVDLVVVEPKTGLTRIIGTLNMNGSIADIVMSPTSPRAAFVFAHHQSGGETAGGVARIDLTDLRLSLDAE